MNIFCLNNYTGDYTFCIGLLCLQLEELNRDVVGAILGSVRELPLSPVFLWLGVNKAFALDTHREGRKGLFLVMTVS